jgi:hypothetical protein
MCNEVVEGGGGEDLSIEAQYQNAHICSFLPEPPSVDAGDNLIQFKWPISRQAAFHCLH